MSPLSTSQASSSQREAAQGPLGRVEDEPHSLLHPPACMGDQGAVSLSQVICEVELNSQSDRAVPGLREEPGQSTGHGVGLLLFFHM